MARKGTSNKVSAQGRGMVLDMLRSSVLSDEEKRVSTFLHIYIFALPCSGAAKVASICVHCILKLGAGCAWGADGKAAGEDRTWAGCRQ